ncbi:MAG: 2-dehydropantoate 2-reductase, partial [uncultured Craurococcus sp.]
EDLHLRARRHRRTSRRAAGEGRGRGLGRRPRRPARGNPGARPDRPPARRRDRMPPEGRRGPGRARPAGRGGRLHQGSGAARRRPRHRPAARAGDAGRLRHQRHTVVVLRPSWRTGGGPARPRGRSRRRGLECHRPGAGHRWRGLLRLLGSRARRHRGHQQVQQADPRRAGRLPQRPRHGARRRLQAGRPALQRRRGHPHGCLGQAAEQPVQRPLLHPHPPQHAGNLPRRHHPRRGRRGGEGGPRHRRRHGPPGRRRGRGPDHPLGRHPAQALHPAGPRGGPADGGGCALPGAAPPGAGARRAGADAGADRRHGGPGRRSRRPLPPGGL